MREVLHLQMLKCFEILSFLAAPSVKEKKKKHQTNGARYEPEK